MTTTTITVIFLGCDSIEINLVPLTFFFFETVPQKTKKNVFTKCKTIICLTLWHRDSCSLLRMLHQLGGGYSSGGDGWWCKVIVVSNPTQVQLQLSWGFYNRLEHIRYPSTTLDGIQKCCNSETGQWTVLLFL